jgi:tRNA dimethylallyltransferase
MVRLKAAQPGKLVVVAGATATGKSDLGIELALWIEHRLGFGAEVVSADSRQVYRGMDIGTGKVTQREMRSVPHHLLNVADPKRPMWNASRFKREALRAIKGIQARGNVPILVGGSGYWIDAVALGREFPDVPMDKKLRRELAKKTVVLLEAQLRELDPARAANVDAKNPVRLIRAIEVALHARSHGAAPKKTVPPSFDVLYLVLDQPDEVLKKKIGARLKKRLAAGMVAEVRRLRENGVSAAKMSMFGLEYRFASEHIDGKYTAAEMENLLALAIWHYAKRQRTWFKRNKNAVRIDAGDKKKTLGEAKKLAQKFLL